MTNLFPFLFLSFPDFPDFSDFFGIGPAVTESISFMLVSFPDLSQNCSLSCSCDFRSFPDLSDLFRRFPDASDRHKSVRLPVPLISVFSGSFRPFLRFSGCVRPLQNCSPSGSCHFRTFPTFPTFSGCVRPPQKCSPACSSHFRIFPDLSDLFQPFPDASDRFKIVPLQVPVISGLFRLFRRFPDASDRHKSVRLPVPLISGVFRIFPTFSNVFRMRPTATKVFACLFLSFPYFPDLSDLFRGFPDASDRHKIDRAPFCLETETQQFVLLGIKLRRRRRRRRQGEGGGGGMMLITPVAARRTYPTLRQESTAHLQKPGVHLTLVRGDMASWCHTGRSCCQGAGPRPEISLFPRSLQSSRQTPGRSKYPGIRYIGTRVSYSTAK